jgi:hypothetical protein
MLINCPRCGFSQPQDQYCAQCGVDMLAFRPKQAPLLIRLLQNTTLQIALLLVATIFAGQYILRSEHPQKWVQKISPFQGVSKSEKSTTSENEAVSSNTQSLSTSEQETTSASQSNELDSLKNRSLRLEKNNELTASSAVSGSSNATNPGSAQDLSSINFKLTYAEVSHESLVKWITESSNLGLYQSFTDYSAGIIYDFKRFSPTETQSLKSANIKLVAGGTNSNISGSMTDDGSQVLGLITTLGYRSAENDAIHGNISVARNSRLGSEPYPAEFGLPKGAAFFMIGILKRESLATDRAKLNMPPFQIFKSSDFLAGKTEFVIIVEPDYK